MTDSGRWGGTRSRVAAAEAGGPGGRGRRWPWAVAAVAAGGLAGAAVAIISRRRGPDPEDVQEPDEVEAVVDRAGAGGG